MVRPGTCSQASQESARYGCRRLKRPAATGQERLLISQEQAPSEIGRTSGLGLTPPSFQPPQERRVLRRSDETPSIPKISPTGC
jgi:hypothetical protein